MTHTFVTLEVSPELFKEVSDKMRDARYDHAFNRVDGFDVVDMYGVALVAERVSSRGPHGGKLTRELQPVPRSGHAELAEASPGLLGCHPMTETRRTVLERLDRNVKLLLRLVPGELQLVFGEPKTRTNLPQGTTHMAKTITDIQHVAITLQEKDAAGNVVPFDFPAPPTWASSDDTIVTVSPSADGSNADVATTGKLGDATITVNGTTADGRPIIGRGDVTVTTSAPATIELVFGDASNK